MIDYAKEKWRKNREKETQRENTIGNLIVTLTIDPIIMALAWLSVKHYGLTITLSLLAIFIIMNEFLFSLNDIIFSLMWKNGLKEFSKFPMRTAKPWISSFVMSLIVYFLLRNQ
ncbi:hypothetical protein ACQCN2_18140 [Brevibacillus ginsengisoli]|uniref:hypothetical protein n=1 Tax=Brevibacillus ginsengisoli TaxID=363854 RepID=UPI003CF3D91C